MADPTTPPNGSPKEAEMRLTPLSVLDNGDELAQFRLRAEESERRLQALQFSAELREADLLKRIAVLEKAVDDFRLAEVMARVGSWSRDLSTGISTWSEGKLLLFGLDPKGPAPMFAETVSMVHPEDREAMARAMQVAIETGRAQRLEYRVTGTDGRELTLESHVSPLPAENRLIGAVRDVTEARSATREIQKKEANLRAILVNMNEGVLLKDSKARILMANPASEELLRLTEREMIGRTTHDPDWQVFRIDGSPMPDSEHPADVVVATSRPSKNVVMGIKFWDGLMRWIRCSAIPLFEEGSDQLEGILCTFVDITDRIENELRLAETNALRGSILASAGYAILSTDPAGAIMSVNQAAEQLTGTPGAELVGYPLASIFSTIAASQEDVAQGIQFSDIFDEVSKNGIQERECLCKRKDGRVISIILSVTALKSDEGKLLGFLGMARDISERKATEEALRASEKRLNESQLLARSGSWEYEICTGRSTWSQGLFTLLGLDPLTCTPSYESLIANVHPEDQAFVANALDGATISGTGFEAEFRYVRGSGDVITLHCSAEVYLENGLPSRVLGNMQDVTERKAAQRQIEWQMRTISSYLAELEAGKHELEEANARLEALATTDGLTGIMNHRAFQEHVDQEFKRARRYETPMSVILLDVDQFKSYNDSFGHQAGDEVLRGVAKTLRSTGRETDSIARYGGEEFVVILPGTGLESALDAAERLRVAIESRPIGARRLTISVGVAEITPAHMKPSDVVSDADRALYFAKEKGRNLVAWIDPQTNRPVVASNGL